MRMRQFVNQSDRGAVAVMFAILAVVIIGAGALAVDLGNAFARKRISQTQADLAALAGAAKLPEGATQTGAAFDEAFDYLVLNTTFGQGDVNLLKEQMRNGNQDDGEIWFPEGNSVIDVLTPPAAVDYALGGVFQQDGIDVQAYARAGVFSPGKIAPFFVPYGCSTPLPSQIFVKSGAESTPTEPTPVFLTPMAAKNGDPSVDTVVPAQVAFGPALNSRTVNDAEMTHGQTALVSSDANFVEAEQDADVIVDGAVFTENGTSRTATGSMIAGSGVLTSDDAVFTVADIGSKVVVPSAGLAGELVTTIETFTSETEVVLAVPASATVDDATVGIFAGTISGLATTIAAFNTESQVQLAEAPDLDVEDAQLTISVPNTLTVEVTGDGFTDAADDADAMVVAFVRGSTSYPVTVQGIDVEIEKYSNPKRDAIAVDVPPEVLSQSASRWYIQVKAATGTAWSFTEDKQNAAILEVSSSADPGDQCGERVTGDFGLLNSPRSDANQLQARLDLNIAEGLDHAVTEFTGTFPPIDDKDNCRISPQTPIGGGVLDDDATVAAGGTPNCLEINNGNKVDATTDGLITGGTNPRAFDGRLDADASASCNRPLRNVLSTDINDDVLSCFLQNGTIQGAINGTDPKFSGEIVDSPRFMFIPVIWASVNPQNGFYPIERFAGAFITEQVPQTTGPATGPVVSPDNGVPVGTQKVQGINVIPFEIDRLPDQIDYSGAVVPYFGAGPKVVRLVK